MKGPRIASTTCLWLRWTVGCAVFGWTLTHFVSAEVPERFPPPETLERFEYSRFKLGTRFRIVFYTGGGELAAEAARQVFERVDKLDQLLSDFRGDSELSRVNARAGNSATRVSRELYEVLSASRRLSQRSGGVFDVTVGPVVKLWRRSFRSQTIPPAGELEAARLLVGFEHLLLDPGPKTVLLRYQGMRLDLGGIAKGFIADEVAALLRSRGIARLLIDAGGDITCGDPPPGLSGWTISLEACGKPVELLLANHSVASSGDLYRYVEVDGIRYSHIVDPRTGRGVRGPVAAAALAPTGMMADAIATAAAIMDVDRIAGFLPDQDDYAVCVSRGIEPNLERVKTPGFDRFLQAP